MTDVPTRCRICESTCGLIATVEDGVVTRLRPNPDHPLSRGYACRKGPAFLEVQNHPDRVTRPLRRGPQGLEPASWEDAVTDIGARLRALHDAHGPEAIGVYLGNATVNSLGAVLGGEALRGGAGTTKGYSALTLDNSEMYVVLEQVMGNPFGSFVADYAHSDLVVLVGTDPVASQPSQIQSRPGAVSTLLERAKAGQLVVVDPRRSETAKRAEHLRPRPGGDAVMLAWLVREVLTSAPHRARLDGDRLFSADDVGLLADAVASFDLERAARESGLTPTELTHLRDRLLAAERPLVWSGLGVLLGPDGTVGYWLTLCLQAALGGIDTDGGWLQQRGAIDFPRLMARTGTKGSDPDRRSRIGDYPAVLGSLASATLAEDILTPGDGQLRALVVVAGNPALSLPDAARAREALDSLELLVSLDLTVNDTGALAHWVLPGATWLERDEVDVQGGNQRMEAHLSLDRAVTPPRGDARPEWETLLAITRAAGWRPFGSLIADLGLRATGATPLTIARALTTFSPVSWRKLARDADGVTLPGSPLGGLRARGSDHPHGRLTLAVPHFITALHGRLGADPRPEGDLALQLVSSVRPVETMNTWLHHSQGASRRVPVARLHPDDLAVLGGPETIRLRRPDDDTLFVDVDARADDGVRPGVVVLPFGWGHHEGALGAGPDGPRGVNANVLVGTDRLEPFTGQPLSNSRWVLAHALGLLLTLLVAGCVTPAPTPVCAGNDADCDGAPSSVDCDDSDPDVNLDATEVCNGVDDDCDGAVDDGFDADGDGVTTCAGDCDDLDPTSYSGAEDLCIDGVDNDCNGIIDDGPYQDEDEDGVCDDLDCDDQDPDVLPGAVEVCDGVDQDCDEEVDEGFDADGDGVTTCAGDCDDDDPSEYPGAPEICDGEDNDCDGTADSPLGPTDSDGDGYDACFDDDCDDDDATVFPGAFEIPDGVDDDCDGEADEGYEGIGNAELFGPGSDGAEELGGLGLVVSNAGDVNADGISDLLVASPNAQQGKGRVFLLLGGAFDLSAPPATWQPHATITGSADGEKLGTGVALVDLDDDGFDDVVVGAPFGGPGSGPEGEVRIFWGQSNPPAGAWPVGSPDVSILGAYGVERCGEGLVHAGDMNGDQHADLAVGCPWYTTPGGIVGRTAVFTGRSRAAWGSVGLSTDADMLIVGQGTEEHTGAVLAGNLDMDGDGLSDLAVGSPDFSGSRGRVGLKLGEVLLPASVELGDVERTWEGAVFDDLGAGLGAGDLTGDGRAELLVLAPGWTSDQGRAHVLLGAQTLPASGFASAAAGWTIEGGVSDGLTGGTISDVSGDGLGDLIISSPGWDGPRGGDQGRVGIFEAPVDTGATTIDGDADAVIQGESGGDGFGTSLQGLDDGNGDGQPDLMIGAPYSDSGASGGGRVLFVPGFP